MSMLVHLHVREKTIPVHCGDGSQTIAWLASVGVARYDDHYGRSLGAAAASSSNSYQRPSNTAQMGEGGGNAIAKQQHNKPRRGLGLQKEGGTLCDPEALIRDTLTSGQHAFVMLRNDVSPTSGGP